jgi:CHASE3 domain sensor protein
LRCGRSSRGKTRAGRSRPGEVRPPPKVVVPLLLGIVASLAILVYAELGYRRLEAANRQMAVAVQMHAAMFEMLTMIVDAETGERGYLLTGKPEYLTPYDDALPKVEGALSRLRELMVQGGSPAQRDMLGRVNSLVGKKLSELEAALALYQKDGAEAAQALLDTGIGKRAMEDIRSEVDGLATTFRRATRRRQPPVDRRHRPRPPRHAADDRVHRRAAAGRVAARAAARSSRRTPAPRHRGQLPPGSGRGRAHAGSPD